MSIWVIWRRLLSAKLGLACLGLTLLGVTVFSLHFFMNRLLEQHASMVGMRWAENVENNIEDAEKFFSGNIDQTTRTDLFSMMSAVGQIYRYEFSDSDGNVLFATGAYHPKAGEHRAEHHSHSHDTAELAANVSRNGQGAAAISKHQSSPHTGAKKVHDNRAALTPVANGHTGHSHEHGSGPGQPMHSIYLGTGDGTNQPRYFANIGHPVFNNGAYLGSIRVFLDQSENHALYRETMFTLLAILFGVCTLGFGIPSGFYLQGKIAAEKADARVKYLAHHDAMTQLVNRNRFVEVVNSCLGDKVDQGEKYALHFIDVDYFKNINDTYGHDVGDELLRQISAKLRATVPPRNTIARFGGDEFAVFQTDLGMDQGVEEFAHILQSAIVGSYRIHGHDITATASVGTSVSGRDGTSFETLMKCADIALYSVKANGRDGCLRFQPDMKRRLDRRRALELAIRQSIPDNRLQIHFQPLFHRRSTELTGFEALVRLVGLDGNIISPADFIPVAEEIGLMENIGEWVLMEATKIATDWPDHLTLSVNLSTTQFESGHLVQTVENVLQVSGLEPSRLELEITENLILNNTDENLKQLHQLKDLGAAIAMDDFGTGYSSLGYLWSFPFDKIKIDQSFLKGFESDPHKVKEIIQTIIALGHSLNMEVTVEGVENSEQLSMLNGLSCDILQGYHLGKPFTQDQLAPLMLRDFVKNHDVAQTENVTKPSDLSASST